MSTLRLRLERWFSAVAESYFLRATVEVRGSAPPGIVESLKIKRADVVTREPEQLIGFCNKIELEQYPEGSDISYLHTPFIQSGMRSGLTGTFLEVAAADIPLPWQELGLVATTQYEILNIDLLLGTFELDGTYPCGVFPIQFTLLSVPLTLTNGLPIRERQYFPESTYVRRESYVAPYDDLDGVIAIMNTLTAGAQALVDEWNEYDDSYEGIELEVFA